MGKKDNDSESQKIILVANILCIPDFRPHIFQSQLSKSHNPCNRPFP